MDRKHPGEIAAGLAAFSHRDRVRIAKEASRLRAEAMTELIHSAGRGRSRCRMKRWNCWQTPKRICW